MNTTAGASTIGVSLQHVSSRGDKRLFSTISLSSFFTGADVISILPLESLEFIEAAENFVSETLFLRGRGLLHQAYDISVQLPWLII